MKKIKPSLTTNTTKEIVKSDRKKRNNERVVNKLIKEGYITPMKRLGGKDVYIKINQKDNGKEIKPVVVAPIEKSEIKVNVVTRRRERQRKTPKETVSISNQKKVTKENKPKKSKTKAKTKNNKKTTKVVKEDKPKEIITNTKPKTDAFKIVKSKKKRQTVGKMDNEIVKSIMNSIEKTKTPKTIQKPSFQTIDILKLECPEDMNTGYLYIKDESSKNREMHNSAFKVQVIKF